MAYPYPGPGSYKPAPRPLMSQKMNASGYHQSEQKFWKSEGGSGHLGHSDFGQRQFGQSGRGDFSHSERGSFGQSRPGSFGQIKGGSFNQSEQCTFGQSDVGLSLSMGSTNNNQWENESCNAETGFQGSRQHGLFDAARGRAQDGGFSREQTWDDSQRGRGIVQNNRGRGHEHISKGSQLGRGRGAQSNNPIKQTQNNGRSEGFQNPGGYTDQFDYHSGTFVSNQGGRGFGSEGRSSGDFGSRGGAAGFVSSGDAGVSGFSSRGGGSRSRGASGLSKGGGGLSRGGGGLSRGGGGLSRGGGGLSRGGTGSSSRGGGGLSSRGRGDSSLRGGGGSSSRGRGGSNSRGGGGLNSRGGGGSNSRGGGLSSRGGGGFSSNGGGGFGSRGVGGGFGSKGSVGFSRQNGGIGRGLSSLGDLVNLAQSRVALQSELIAYIEEWKAWLIQSQDPDPITAIHVSLEQAKVPNLDVHFSCKFLCHVSNYDLFTGTLILNDYFLSRGLGATKQSCMVDTYGKAFDLLYNCEVDEVLNQVDPGEIMLCQEVQKLFTQDPRMFIQMLQQSSDLALSSVPVTGMKRPAPKPLFPEGAKRPKGPNPWPESNALVPKKKVGILMDPYDSLPDKLVTFKKLLKEEGITKLHLVPKIDQIAHKTAINIKNVYRFCGNPQLGIGTPPVVMEIYFDDVRMVCGGEHPRRGDAMHDAYNKLANILSTMPVEKLASGSGYWHSLMENEPDVSHVVVKWQGEDNNSLLTTNLANMKQMMQSTPDFSIPLHRLILTEHEADKEGQNIFKLLELSCTRNCMLLECEIVRNPDNTFTCTMSLQGKQIGKRTNATKQGSKRSCSEFVMKQFLKNNDHIYVKKDYHGKIITKKELVDSGKKLKEEGHPPVKNYMPPLPAEPVPKQQPKPKTTGSSKDKKKANTLLYDLDGNEKLPVNKALIPLMPYMAAAFNKIIDNYYMEVTMDDLMLDIKDLSKSQFEMLTHLATRMGLRVISKGGPNKTETNISLLRRSLKAPDISKILQLKDGKSGRYEFRQLVHKSTAQELQDFRTDYLSKHLAMVVSREQPEPVNKHMF